MANASGRWTYCGGATSGTARCQHRQEEERHTNETGGEPDKKGTKSKGEEGEGDNEGEEKEGAERNPPKERRKADKNQPKIVEWFKKEGLGSRKAPTGGKTGVG